MLKVGKWKNTVFLTQILIIYYWLSFLVSTDSYYSVYLFTGMLGGLCCGINCKEQTFPENKKETVWTFLFAHTLSTAVVLANYAMFTKSESSWWSKIVSVSLLYFGGLLCFWNILVFLSVRLRNFSFKNESLRKLPTFAVFLLLMVPLVTVDILLLFLCEYPVNLSPDGLDQIKQILTGVYSNHHPFYHTVIIGFFMKMGYALFGDINAAVAVYSVFQVLLMAGCFGFAMVTLYQAGIPFKYIIACILFYTFMPFHIVYSFTMWKDVMFGGFVLLFITAIFRLLTLPDNDRPKVFDYAMFVFGSFGVCLLRSNGWFVYVLTAVAFALLFWKKYKKLCFGFLIMITVSFMLKHPVLAMLKVSQPDVLESISIPIQQVARVVVECNDLTADQEALLDQIVEVNEVSETYINYISDPLKALIRQKGNQDYLLEHRGEFIKFYIELGLKHPKQYFYAWIDQTRGFWNGGYNYWKWTRGIINNDYGISKSVNLESARKCFSRYLSLYEKSNVLVLFISIGFYVWIVGIMCYISLIRRDRVSFFLTLPVLSVILSLSVATPVYSEFRYAYAVFCTIPFLLLAPFADRSRVKKEDLQKADKDK